jgi:hypothetical protein
MSQGVLTLVGGCLSAVLLLVLVARTVLVEVRAGRGGDTARTVRRTRPVIVLDIAGWVLVIVLLAILVQPLLAALGR